MLLILRIIFTGLFFYCVVQARDNAENNLVAGDMTNAFWVGAGVIVAIVCAATWAPYIGGKVADPMAGGMVNSEPIERPKRLLRIIRWLDAKERSPGLIRFLCFIEGVRVPWLPTAFKIGLRHAKPGSWLEKVYAREVFRFNNVESCMRAFEVLQRHGIDPRPHNNPDVNTALMSLDRGAAPDPSLMHVAPAPPPPPLKRNERIKIGPS